MCVLDVFVIVNLSCIFCDCDEVVHVYDLNLYIQNVISRVEHT